MNRNSSSRMKAVLLCIICIFTFTHTSCGPPDIKKAMRASSELADDTGSVIKLVSDMYDQGQLSLEKKDKLAHLLVLISQGGGAFNKLVTAAAKAPDGGQSQLGFLALNFESVSKPFLEFLEELKLLSGSQSTAIAASIAALQTAVIIIAASLKGSGAKTGHATNRLLQTFREAA